jgi:hypothetical protein
MARDADIASRQMQIANTEATITFMDLSLPFKYAAKQRLGTRKKSGYLEAEDRLTNAGGANAGASADANRDASDGASGGASACANAPLPVSDAPPRLRW